MRWKIILGIFLPLVIIINLAILGTLNINFTVDENYVNSISLEEITSSGSITKTVKLADITLDNDYFLSKRYSLPPLGACLIDNEGTKQNLNAGIVEYSEGNYDPLNGEPIFETYSYRSSKGRSIQIGSHEQKKINIFLTPAYNFKNKKQEQILNDYGNFDSLLIFEIDNSPFGRNYFTSCTRIDQQTINNAKRIPLVN
jgi:hypothetical protein